MFGTENEYPMESMRDPRPDVVAREDQVRDSESV